jgi:hypothetical protein
VAGGEAGFEGGDEGLEGLLVGSGGLNEEAAAGASQRWARARPWASSSPGRKWRTLEAWTASREAGRWSSWGKRPGRRWKRER